MNTDRIYAESIVNEYSTKDDSKVIALRKLDRKAKFPATIFVYAFGIIATLLAGLGMCLSMGVTSHHVVLGIVIGVIGFILMGLNYPIYKKMLKRGKQKYAFEIVELAKRISNE